MMTARGINDTNPRAQFIDDFISQFGQICSNDNKYVLLALDSNAILTEDRSGMGKLIEECCMVDM
jgi:hypothetical protein